MRPLTLVVVITLLSVAGCTVQPPTASPSADLLLKPRAPIGVDRCFDDDGNPIGFAVDSEPRIRPNRVVAWYPVRPNDGYFVSGFGAAIDDTTPGPPRLFDLELKTLEVDGDTLLVDVRRGKSGDVTFGYYLTIVEQTAAGNVLHSAYPSCDDIPSGILDPGVLAAPSPDPPPKVIIEFG